MIGKFRYPLSATIFFILVLCNGCEFATHQAATVPPKFQSKAPEKRITNSIGMEFVLIPEGVFTMGSSKGVNREKPLHQVNISQPFYLQTTKVTQGQWEKIMGDNSSYYKDRMKCGEDCPVETVSWYDAKEFIERLNAIENTDQYRLPYEAEWEYACMAGRDSEYSFEESSNLGNEYDWCCKEVKLSDKRIATREPNSWGLYEMRGARVEEFLEDDYHANYQGAPDQGFAWVDNPRGSKRVMRGGSDCKWFVRSGQWPGSSSSSVGFRLAKSVFLDP